MSVTVVLYIEGEQAIEWERTVEETEGYREDSRPRRDRGP
jgi:hypothetical protein